MSSFGTQVNGIVEIIADEGREVYAKGSGIEASDGVRVRVPLMPWLDGVGNNAAYSPRPMFGEAYSLDDE